MDPAILRSKAILSEIARLLEQGGENRSAQMIRQALNHDTQEIIERFLISNELWGGAGSIADESLISNPILRGSLQSLLLDLGELQLSSGKTNPRTEMWVRAFAQWRQ